MERRQIIPDKKKKLFVAETYREVPSTSTSSSPDNVTESDEEPEKIGTQTSPKTCERIILFCLFGS